MKKLTLFALAAGAALAVSCSSLQDVYVNMDEIEKSADIQRIERALAFLDGEYLANGSSANFKLADFKTNCTAVAKDAEKSLGVQGLQKIPEARLLALEGRAYQLAQNTSRAKSLYAQSAAVYATDTQNVILASRLGMSADLESDLHDSGEKALLTLEKAVRAYREARYADAAAQFDTAFLSLDAYYRDAYADARAKAWELRSVAPLSDSVLTQNAVTVAQMLALTDEQTNLLFNYTAGKKLSDNELYKRLSAAGLLTPISAVTGDRSSLPAAKETVSRMLAARFLWNLYAGGKATATRYSNLYRARGMDSPIPDVAVTSADFDATLGVVENEIMSLPDGVHFYGDEAISAVDLHTSLGKIK